MPTLRSSAQGGLFAFPLGVALLTKKLGATMLYSGRSVTRPPTSARLGAMTAVVAQPSVVLEAPDCQPERAACGSVELAVPSPSFTHLIHLYLTQNDGLQSEGSESPGSL